MPANQNTGPYSQDILTLIYNVQWGGLAVEFGDKDQPPPGEKPGGK
jgi:hypothetical protein